MDDDAPLAVGEVGQAQRRGRQGPGYGYDVAERDRDRGGHQRRNGRGPAQEYVMEE